MHEKEKFIKRVKYGKHAARGIARRARFRFRIAERDRKGAKNIAQTLVFFIGIWYNKAIKYSDGVNMLTERAVLTTTEAAQVNAVTLAFVGDTVYSLYVRERLTLEVGGKSSDLQKLAANIVSAKGQSAFADKLLPLLTEDEADVFRRAKNAKKGAKSKSASQLEYNRSTGFEAVLGYLYLTGNEGRIKELLSYSEDAEYRRAERVQPFKPVRR